MNLFKISADPAKTKKIQEYCSYFMPSGTYIMNNDFFWNTELGTL